MNRKWFFLLVAALVLSGCKTNHLAEIQPQTYRMADTTVVAADASIEKLIAPYKAQLDVEMNGVIGVAAETLDKRTPESLLGNWMCDLLYEQIEVYTGAEIDFASVNYGGIRIPTIQKGEITKGKIFELMPFDNMIVVIYLDAATLRQFIDKIAQDGGIPVSRQLRFEIKDRKPQNITIKGQPIQEDKIYKVGITDYVANGGDDCSFFVDKKQDNLGKLYRDAIIEYTLKQTAQGKQIESKLDGRIKILK